MLAAHLTIPPVPEKPYTLGEKLLFGSTWFCAIAVFLGLLATIIITYQASLAPSLQVPAKPEKDFLTLWNQTSIFFGIIEAAFLAFATCRIHWIKRKQKQQEQPTQPC